MSTTAGVCHPVGLFTRVSASLHTRSAKQTSFFFLSSSRSFTSFFSSCSSFVSCRMTTKCVQNPCTKWTLQTHSILMVCFSAHRNTVASSPILCFLFPVESVQAGIPPHLHPTQRQTLDSHATHLSLLLGLLLLLLLLRLHRLGEPRDQLRLEALRVDSARLQLAPQIAHLRDTGASPSPRVHQFCVREQVPCAHRV